MNAPRRGGRRPSAGKDLRTVARRSGRVVGAGAASTRSPSTTVESLGDRVDASTAYLCFARCVAARAPHVVADLSSTTFMDRAGYGALMSARDIIEHRGGSFELRGAGGQPSRLLHLISRPG